MDFMFVCLQRGCRHESFLVPFGEVVMEKIAVGDKLRAGELDSTWVKAVWVGRVDQSNEHLLLTRKGCIRSRDVRRIPDGNQASHHAEVMGLPWYTFKGIAEMLRNATVRPGEPPRTTTTTTGREAAQDDPMPGSSDDHLRRPPTDEPVVIEQEMAIDTEVPGVSDDRPEQGVLRMDEEGATEVEKQTAWTTIVDR